MATFSLNGNDTITFNGTVLLDLPNGKIVEVTWDDTLIEQKVGKNGNTISVFKPMGSKAKATLRVLRASSNDVIINSSLVQMQADFPSATPITLNLNKRFGNGSGDLSSVVSDTIILSNGFITKNPSISSDVDGDTEQSVTIYEMTFPIFTRIVT